MLSCSNNLAIGYSDPKKDFSDVTFLVAGSVIPSNEEERWGWAIRNGLHNTGYAIILFRSLMKAMVKARRLWSRQTYSKKKELTLVIST
jgi:hypothetical protein